MTSALPDIRTDIDIRRLVDGFYQRVRADELLGPVFGAVVGDQWPRHLATMYDFWSGLLLGTGRYRGRPFPKHLALPIDGRHFRRWLTLFVETTEVCFRGAVADEAIYRAGTIAAVFEHRISQARNRPGDFDVNGHHSI
ncbi:group III truncated hemoglobin [Hymenobacter rubripertinctus]|uniref:Group III truncated hemoglobin n=1 Tax=Hymenobacter rubripertinctus TaxID=2029981 RepID=A0A418R4R8_9BACT|nr:group III truncated hemoglobin [Hymenobacter rubripertinctus]RIY12468.1 group III truncated hemoglobin [Hymenobacter rubripertinctus]